MRGVWGGGLVLGEVVVAVEDVDGGDLDVREAHAAVRTLLLEDNCIDLALGLRVARLFGRHFSSERSALVLDKGQVRGCARFGGFVREMMKQCVVSKVF